MQAEAMERYHLWSQPPSPTLNNSSTSSHTHNHSQEDANDVFEPRHDDVDRFELEYPVQIEEDDQERQTTELPLSDTFLGDEIERDSPKNHAGVYVERNGSEEKEKDEEKRQGQGTLAMPLFLNVSHVNGRRLLPLGNTDCGNHSLCINTEHDASQCVYGQW
jgi:hypothetical protein